MISKLRFRTKEELEKALNTAGVKYESILEEEEKFVVFTNKGVRFFFKPRSRERTIEILKEAKFPPSILNNLYKEIGTKPLKLVRGYLKKGLWGKGLGLVFVGRPGVGKTHALTKAIAVLLKNQIIHQPVYIPFHELSNEEIRSRLDVFDAVLLDDINISLPEWKVQLLEEVIFQLYNRGALIFLTSNSSLEELRQMLSGAIWSRLEERCLFQEFPEGEDVRKVLKIRGLKVFSNL